MSVKSAKNGKVQWQGADVKHARGWDVTDMVEELVYASSNTAGTKAREAGHSDVSGSFNVFRDSITSLTAVGIIPGAVGQVNLFPDRNAAAEYSGMWVMIGQIQKAINVETGELIGYVVNFGRTLDPSANP